MSELLKMVVVIPDAMVRPVVSEIVPGPDGPPDMVSQPQHMDRGGGMFALAVEADQRGLSSFHHLGVKLARRIASGTCPSLAPIRDPVCQHKRYQLICMPTVESNILAIAMEVYSASISVAIEG